MPTIKRVQIAHGILTWDGIERRSQRYGTFILDNTDYYSNVHVLNFVNKAHLQTLVGKQVRLTAKVLKSRDSGHVGDQFLHIFPSKPKAKEEVEIGVGHLFIEKGFGGNTAIGLIPSDGRETLWLNPIKLYRLHDQTIDIFIEETTDKDSPKAEFSDEGSEGGIANGDGTIQILDRQAFKRKADIFAPPKFTSLGDGLFVVGPQKVPEKGDRVNVEFRQKNP
ncbi:MAG: hypothetical protein WCS56_00205 [Bacilli bacterium]